MKKNIIFLLSSLLFSGASLAQNINQKILNASMDGDIKNLNIYLLNDSVNLNYKAEDGYTALDYAIERNHKEVFSRLINYYSDKAEKDTIHIGTKRSELLSSNRLMEAVLSNDIDLIKQLLSKNVDPNYKHCSGYFPLSIAVRWENDKSIDLLLAKNADVNAVNSNRYLTVPLMELSRNGNVSIGKLLFRNGALVNKVDINNDPALNWAVYFGYTGLVKLFLQEGAITTLVGKDSGDDSVAIAKRMGFSEIESILLSYRK